MYQPRRHNFIANVHNELNEYIWENETCVKMPRPKKGGRPHRLSRVGRGPLAFETQILRVCVSMATLFACRSGGADGA